METITVIDNQVDLTKEVACYFKECPHLAIWSGHHSCLDPQTVFLCPNHRLEIIYYLTRKTFSGPDCPVGHRHTASEIVWQQL